MGTRRSREGRAQGGDRDYTLVTMRIFEIAGRTPWDKVVLFVEAPLVWISMATKSKSDPNAGGDDVKWTWEKDNVLMSGVAGDVAALFRAEGVDTPGILAVDPPTSETSLFAREAIQNSWDAAREWRTTCEKSGRKVAPFSIEFKFVELSGDERRRFVATLGLTEHQSQFDAARRQGSAKNNLGLAENDLLARLHDGDRPVRLLVMTESAGLGMPGNLKDSESRMVQALLRVGYTQKADGAGGNYGYGKAGLIQASAIRLVVAYSAFAEGTSEPGVTRRLLGVTYWKSHKRARIGGGNESFTGWARFGRFAPIGDGIPSAVPYENEEADDVAASLGITVRDPLDPSGTGTTFLLLEPTIDAPNLKKAIERYWWPAILDSSSGLRTKIVDYDGTESYPSVPKDDPNFVPFVRAFELATRPQDNPHTEEHSADLGQYTPQSGDSYSLGRIGLVADTKGWSFPDDGLDHQTLIALVRGPRMVVDYLTFKNFGIPHVRGTFVADRNIDDLLRQTEDKAHTKWETRPLDGAHPHAHLVAKQVNDRIRARTTEFKGRFKPPAPRPGDLNLPVLDELSRLMKGRKITPPKPQPRSVTINLVEPAHVEVTKSGLLRCEAVVEFGVSDWVWEALGDEVEDVEVTVTLSMAFVEDEKVGEKMGLEVSTLPRGFVELPTKNESRTFVGRLSRGVSATFAVGSAEYESDWTVRFTPIASVTQPSSVKPKPKKAGS